MNNPIQFAFCYRKREHTYWLAITDDGSRQIYDWAATGTVKEEVKKMGWFIEVGTRCFDKAFVRAMAPPTRRWHL
jgi:hypothetical protein